MVAAMFLHESFCHIAFNMVALWFLGEYTEAVLGRVKFLVLYLVTGLAGSVFVVLFASPFSVTVGASGAIAGAFGGLMAYAYLNRHRDYVARAIFGQLVFWFVLNLVLNVYSQQRRHLSWQGHVGGFVAGVILMAAYTMLGRKNPFGRFSARRRRSHGDRPRGARRPHLLARADGDAGGAHPLVVASPDDWRPAPPRDARRRSCRHKAKDQAGNRRSSSRAPCPFPRAEVERRLAAFQQTLRSGGVDAALVVQNADLYYLTGTVQQSHLLVPADGEPVLLCRRQSRAPARNRRCRSRSCVPSAASASSSPSARRGARGRSVWSSTCCP